MPADSFATPILAILAFLAAWLAAATLLRFFGPARQGLPPADSGRYRSIDGLRGYLAFGVFVHHCVVTWFYLQTGQWVVPASNFYAQLGQTSVALFFMITAFLFWGRLVDQAAGIRWRDLYISRIFRLFPLYFFALAVMLLIVFASSQWVLLEPGRRFLRELAQWFFFATPNNPDLNRFNDTNLLIAGVVWTLHYEWLFYLALPVFGLVFARSGKPLAAALAIGALLVLFGVYHWQNPFDLNILASFLGGILAVYWVRQPVLRTLGQGPPAGVLALLCIFGVMFLAPTAYAAGPILFLSIFFVIIASGNELFGALRLRASLWMGEISYSIYLLHGLLLWLLLQRLLPLAAVPGPREILFMILVPILGMLLVVLSTLTHLCIEKPGMIAGRRLAGVLDRLGQGDRGTSN